MNLRGDASLSRFLERKRLTRYTAFTTAAFHYTWVVYPCTLAGAKSCSTFGKEWS